MDADSPSGPVARPLRWRLVARGEERQLAVLRQWASGLLPACPARDDVVMVANELAGNAIRHTASGRDGWFAVEMTWYGSLVRVAVADCGGPKEPVVIEDPGGVSGRGLFLVQQLSARMGVSGNQSGRLVWADIAWTAPHGIRAVFHTERTTLNCGNSVGTAGFEPVTP